MLKIQFAKRYPWDLHKAVILKLYAARIGAYFSRVSASVCVCVSVRECVSVSVCVWRTTSYPRSRAQLKPAAMSITLLVLVIWVRQDFQLQLQLDPVPYPLTPHPPPLLPLTICSALALFRSQRNSKFFTANRRLSLGCKWKTIKFIEITCCCLKCVVAHCVAACAGVVVVVVVLHAAVALPLSLFLCPAVSVSFCVPVLAASFAIVNIKSQTVKPLLATHAYTDKQTHTDTLAHTHTRTHTRPSIHA